MAGQARDRFVAGVYGLADTGIGVRAHARSGRGVLADTVTGVGVMGNAFGSGTGVLAATLTGNALEAFSSGTGRAVLAESKGQAVLARSEEEVGVYAVSEEDTALFTQGGAYGAHLNGALADLRLGGRATSPASDTRAHEAGEVIGMADGTVLLCTEAGTPGTWRRMGGPGGAGAFSVLPSPRRMYDSRPGALPVVGTKAPLAPGETRALDVNASGELLPADATAALVTVLLVNAAAGAGNVTLWAAGTPKPLSNTLVWGGDAGRFTTSAVTALRGGRVQIHASLKTHVVLDVVGFYR